jgi:hypothetical protein
MSTNKDHLGAPVIIAIVIGVLAQHKQVHAQDVLCSVNTAGTTTVVSTQQTTW